MIIGQFELLDRLDAMVTFNKFSQFSILVGPTGSGKKLVAELIAKALEADTVSVVTPKIESIQNMITTAKSSSGRVVFLIFDADTMSTQSKNATLKLFEEPPKDVYFILTVSDLGTVPTTTLSRALVLHMNPYSTSQLVEYVNKKFPNTDADTRKLVTSICEVPGEINQLLSINTNEFYEYVKSVINNIARVQGSNSFKIADKLNLKDEPDKYDVKLFLKAFMTYCLDNLSPETMLRYLRAVHLTDEYLNELSLSGANKQMIIDNWILDIRRAWM